MTRQGPAAEANISTSFHMPPIVAMLFGGHRGGGVEQLVSAAAIAAANAVTVILTFTTAGHRDELMKEER
jgi:hypothetical protein